MVAVGEIWEGHELVSEIGQGMAHTFLARQVGDARTLVWCDGPNACIDIRRHGQGKGDS